mgnify:CR=1 FL=1
MLVVLLLACGLKSPPQAPPEPVPVVAPPAPIVAPPAPVVLQPDGTGSNAADPEAVPLLRRLSVRDPEPTCDEIESGLADAVAELVHVAETVTMPPWAGMRAAACVASGHSEAAMDTLTKWVSDPEMKGLGLVTVQHLDAMSEEHALSVANAALAGPIADDVRDDLQASAHPSVVELVAE